MSRIVLLVPLLSEIGKEELVLVNYKIFMVFLMKQGTYTSLEPIKIYKRAYRPSFNC